MTRYIKTRHNLMSQIRSPIVLRPTGPWCHLCDRILDGEEIVEFFKTGCKVLGKHHAAEQLATFDFETETWQDDFFRGPTIKGVSDACGDLNRAMRTFKWFAPEVV